jgi:hypothetical protein
MTSGPMRAEAKHDSKYIFKDFSKNEKAASRDTIEWPTLIWQWRVPMFLLDTDEGVALILSDGC